MKRLFFTIIFVAVFAFTTNSKTAAQAKFAFNMGDQVHAITLDNCSGKAGTKCTSGTGPMATVTAMVAFGEANKFTLVIPQLKSEYKGTYIETGPNCYISDTWEDKTQNRGLKMVRPEVIWVSRNNGFIQNSMVIDGVQNKLYITRAADNLIKKWGFKLAYDPFMLRMPSGTIGYREYGPTVIVETEGNFVKIHSIDRQGNETLIALRSNEEMELIGNSD